MQNVPSRVIAVLCFLMTSSQSIELPTKVTSSALSGHLPSNLPARSP
jgi:hypothetical protein